MKAFVMAVLAAVVISVGMSQLLSRAGFSASDNISVGNVRLGEPG